MRQGKLLESVHSSYFEMRLIKTEGEKRKTHFLNFHIKKTKNKKPKRKKAENLERAKSRERKGPAPESKVPKPKLPPCSHVDSSNSSILLPISPQHSPSSASTR